MKLLEKEHLQKTAMELLEQYLQFQQEVEKEGKKVRKEKDALKQNIRCQLSSCSRKNAVKLCYKRRKPSLRYISKIAGEEWKNMAEEQKAPYEEEQNGIFSCASSI
ncbi:hypothetical protein ZIOFF_002498 [Zingiber officinale]|uniref:HMG box domain-containing protein n=1 Tax=Zingiber officinale TaxID=94328 RepID=A0A8J5GXT7_ZINOF|nr:hypothetical protein ZIOFF_034028 [Zingiber officinale]KAG6537408.1 hypothetical protein ZIOFF_002498 [Zingiber officinale]